MKLGEFNHKQDICSVALNRLSSSAETTVIDRPYQAIKIVVRNSDDGRRNRTNFVATTKISRTLKYKVKQEKITIRCTGH